MQIPVLFELASSASLSGYFKTAIKSTFNSAATDIFFFFFAFSTGTVGSKIIRALAIILPIFLWFEYQFLSSHACYKQYKA